jgi:hypothetical protein
MISKEKLKKHIDNFPNDQVSIDEVIDRLVFIQKLEKRIAASEEKNSKIYSEEEIKNQINSWSK